MGTLSLNHSVHDLCKEYPGLVDLLSQLGFEGITNPIMMRTAAKVMTIPTAAAMKGIDMKKIIGTLETAGYQVRGGEQIYE